MKKVELLSPVGNWEMLYQAIHNGADAVYLAGSNYGARKFARNFTAEELIEAIEYAHLYGVKVYVTVNTLIYEEEIEDVIEYLGFLHQNNADAVIMQDMGFIQVARRIYPNLEIHASTQCHNHNQEIVSLWKQLGITRVVFAREMSLEEIQNIDIEIEKEVFVYGALCVCYSGCCLFSSLNGGRSGNRGECVGSCRLPYQLVCNGKEIDVNGKYLLSTKELNTMDYVRKLMEAGIDSFKIEGRMKSPYYVGYVTRLYRMLIDKYYLGEETKLTKEEVNNLKKLFHRQFTKGYLFQDRDIMNIQSPNHLGIEIGRVIQVDKKQIMIKLTEDGLSQNDGIRFQKLGEGMMINRLYNQKKLLVNRVEKGNFCFLDNRFGVHRGDVVLKTIDSKLLEELECIPYKKILVDMRVKCFFGEKLVLEIRDESHTITVYGEVVEKAIKREVTEEDIKRQLSKLGNTPFEIHHLEIEKDEGIFVNLKDLNDIRREAIDKLMNARMRKKALFVKNTLREDNFEIEEENNIYLNALVRNEDQLKCCLDNHINDIYVTDYSLYLKYKNYSNIYYRIKRVNLNYLEYTNERLLVGELGSVEKYHDNNTIVGDYYLNVTNHHSIEFLKKLGVRRVTLSVELNDNQIKNVMKKNYPVELIIYGRLELMVMKYCPLKKCLNYCSKCKNHQDKFSLKDKTGKLYPMIREDCLTHIMANQNINKIDKIREFKKMGIHHYRLELFDEDYHEVNKIIKKLKEKMKESTK